MNKKIVLIIVILISWTQITFSSAQDVKKFFSSLFEDAPAARPASSAAGPGGKVSAELAQKVAAPKPPLAAKKPFPFVQHALRVLLNVSDVMRNPDGGESADLVALDVIAGSVKKNMVKFKDSEIKRVVESYDHLFSAHTMPQ